MNLCLGIDLGTTYSCVSYIDSEGQPCVISTSDNTLTTPSVIWFDGVTAFVGKKANDRKIMPSSPVYEFVKRDIGKPKQINTRYEIKGFYYGATGISAIILRKLKKEAFNYFKRKGLIEKELDEKSTPLNAVITVPAYFGDLQRQETRNAGFAAGLNVVAIINEPTAAAIAYGRTINQNKKILVFDLGGGTFDVTLLEFINGEGLVIASDGADQLGGKDWDEIIMDYLYFEFKRQTGRNIPDDMGWEINQKAIQAKYELTDEESTTVFISSESGDVEITLYRKPPPDFDMFEMDESRPFYFEERSSNLLSLCRTICESVLAKANLTWGDIDEIVMAGGSCRMPMVHDMLEELTGKKIIKNIPGFSFDTAISIGAAIYGSQRQIIRDITSKTVGLELKFNGRSYIEHLINKNTPLPVSVKEQFPAENNAVLKIYEGDSVRPEECILRGRLELGNPEGRVEVSMTINEDGILQSVVEFPPNFKKILTIKTDDEDTDLIKLKQKVQSLDIKI